LLWLCQSRSLKQLVILREIGKEGLTKQDLSQMIKDFIQLKEKWDKIEEISVKILDLVQTEQNIFIVSEFI
jgi:hypothetical protein